MAFHANLTRPMSSDGPVSLVLNRCGLEPMHTWTARTCRAGHGPRPQQHSILAARQLERRTMISYAYYSPLGKTDRMYAQCRSNLDHFLRRGLPPHDGHNHPDVILNVIGDTPVPSLGGRRITIRRRALGPADLFVHVQALRETLGRNDDTYYFVFLNCGVRGPYLMPASHPTARLGVASWLEPFTSLLRNGAMISGPSISCQPSPHLQSYFVVGTKQAAEQFILPKWGKEDNNKTRIIIESEIGLSTAVIQAGFKIASLQSWGATFMPMDCMRLCQSNPTLFAQDPFELIFLKHGGNSLPPEGSCKTNLIHVVDSVLTRSALDEKSLKDFKTCCAARQYEDPESPQSPSTLPPKETQLTPTQAILWAKKKAKHGDRAAEKGDAYRAKLAALHDAYSTAAERRTMEAKVRAGAAALPPTPQSRTPGQESKPAKGSEQEALNDAYSTVAEGSAIRTKAEAGAAAQPPQSLTPSEARKLAKRAELAKRQQLSTS